MTLVEERHLEQGTPSLDALLWELLNWRQRHQPGATLPSGIPWETVQARARQLMLEPLLYHSLSAADGLPASSATAFRAAYHFTARRNALLFHELGRALAALSAAHLPAIVLKGAALAPLLYESVALRPLRDIDLLIRPRDVPLAVRVLDDLGYVMAETEPHAGQALDYENELLLRRRGAGNTVIPLELHWNLLDSPHYQRSVDVAWLWRHAHPAEIGRAPALVLGREAQLLHLAAHLALHHQGEGLLWQYDIWLFLQRHAPELNWERLLRHAGQYDLVLALQTVLLPLCELGAPVPPQVIGELEALVPDAVETRLFAELRTKERPVVRRFYTDLVTMRSWRRRLHYAFTSLFPSPDYMRRRYPEHRDRWLPLLYPYRVYVGFAEWRRLRRKEVA